MKKSSVIVTLIAISLQIDFVHPALAEEIAPLSFGTHNSNLVLVDTSKEEKQREAFANMMDRANLGFNPSATPSGKASSRLLFELSLNRSGYEFSGIQKLLNVDGLESNAKAAALALAQKYNDLDMIKLLLDNGADINTLNENNDTLLRHSIRHNHTEITLELVKRGADLKTVDHLGMTPLMIAAELGDLAVVKALINAGADVNYIKESEYGEQDALYWAYRSGDREVAKALIDAGADKDKRYDSLSTKPDLDGPRQCSKATKLCPDQTKRVLRTGPSCEFEACPAIQEVMPSDVIKGTFSEIDTKLSKDVIRTLKNGTKDQKDQAIADIKSTPGKYNPAALKALSHILFSRIEDREGAFWFLTADLRNRYDTFICRNDSALSRSHSFNSGIPQFKPFAELNPDMMKMLYDEVLQWDMVTPYEYDHRWVTIGDGRKENKLSDPMPTEICLPQEKWEEAKKFNRDQYSSIFQSYIQSFDYRAVPPARAEISETDFKMLLDKAEKGDSDAQFKLAIMSPMPKNLIEGDVSDFKRKWLIASAQKEHIGALNALGQQYVLGMDIPQEQRVEKFQEGKLLLIKAGQKGALLSFSILGGSYLNKKEPIEAYAWYSLDEFAQQKRNSKIQVSQSTRKRAELEITLSSADLERAKKLAQEYIQTYGSEIK